MPLDREARFLRDERSGKVERRAPLRQEPPHQRAVAAALVLAVAADREIGRVRKRGEQVHTRPASGRLVVEPGAPLAADPSRRRGSARGARRSRAGPSRGGPRKRAPVRHPERFLLVFLQGNRALNPGSFRRRFHPGRPAESADETAACGARLAGPSSAVPGRLERHGINRRGQDLRRGGVAVRTSGARRGEDQRMGGSGQVRRVRVRPVLCPGGNDKERLVESSDGQSLPAPGPRASRRGLPVDPSQTAANRHTAIGRPSKKLRQLEARSGGTGCACRGSNPGLPTKQNLAN